MFVLTFNYSKFVTNVNTLKDMKTNYIGVDVTRPNQKLIIMRGIPGSGKSTLASQLVGEGKIHSTDTLIDELGDYLEFWDKMIEAEDFSPLKKLHNQNIKNTRRSMLEGVSIVIVDNTNLRPSEIKPYVRFALEQGYADENIILQNVGTGGQTPKVLAERNTHNVALEQINAMISRFNHFKDIGIKEIMEAKEDILYCSVVLSDASKSVIMDMFGQHIPEGWKVFNHHMTIRFGKGLPEELKGDLGTNQYLRITHLGKSDMAMAVKVDGYHSDNEQPHVTLAVNVNDGGKPVMSNDITKWVELSSPIRIMGVVTEHPR
jgi:predicted kinase